MPPTKFQQALADELAHEAVERAREVEAIEESKTMTTNGRDFPNSGILFRNDRKRERSNDPDYKGTADIQCQCGRRFTRKLAGWIKQGRNGKFLTVSLKPRPEGDDAQAGDDARF